MSKNIRSQYIKNLVADKETLSEQLKANTKESLRSLLEDTVKDSLRDILNEDDEKDKDSFDVEDVNTDNTTDDNTTPEITDEPSTDDASADDTASSEPEEVTTDENPETTDEPAIDSTEGDSMDSEEDEQTPSDKFYNSKYYSVLNVNGDGIMGYLSIPKINLKLPIMHGTYDEFIQRALGHMNGTALPIGGEGTHSVIVGHRGLPQAELFTNIDQLKEGDKFYIHVLDEVHAYQVDKIYPMIEADDIDTLTEALAVEDGKDYVTLFTCTPYGVNTHRLLVRGSRVEYLGEDEPPKGAQAVVETVYDYYLIVFIAGLILAIIIILIIRWLLKKKNE